MPTKDALFKARTRLGPEPLQALFQVGGPPVATPMNGEVSTQVAES